MIKPKKDRPLIIALELSEEQLEKLEKIYRKSKRRKKSFSAFIDTVIENAYDVDFVGYIKKELNKQTFHYAITKEGKANKTITFLADIYKTSKREIARIMIKHYLEKNAL